MKPILIYELSFILSFFSKKYDLEEIDLKHFGYFINDTENEDQLTCLFALKQEGVSSSQTYLGKKAMPWNDISTEEYNFCVSRLAKNMTHKEKIYTVIMLIELCRANSSFYLDRLSFVKEIALGLNLDSLTFSLLQKLALTSKTDKIKKDKDKNIVVIRKADLAENPKAAKLDDPDSFTPLFAFVYLHEEKLFLFKPFENDQKINFASIDIDKLYPLNEGDIVSVMGKIMSFNEVFRLYYNYSTFYPLYIEQTETTPLVNFHPKSNVLNIKGCSVPEDGVSFYIPVLNWIDNYLRTKPKEITLNVQLDYFNTTSSKFIFEMLKRLEKYKTKDIKLVVNWFFVNGDEDLEEAGLVYSDVVDIPFAFIPQEY